MGSLSGTGFLLRLSWTLARAFSTLASVHFMVVRAHYCQCHLFYFSPCQLSHHGEEASIAAWSSAESHMKDGHFRRLIERKTRGFRRSRATPQEENQRMIMFCRTLPRPPRSVLHDARYARSFRLLREFSGLCRRPSRSDLFGGGKATCWPPATSR